MADADEFLEHYGIPGMRWGVRRSRGSNGRVGRKTSSSSKDRSQVDKLARRPVKSLSNKQIQQINNRFQLEKTFNQMRTERSVINRGHNYVKTGLAVAGTGVAIYKLVNSKAGQAAIETGRAAIDAALKAARARAGLGF